MTTRWPASKLSLSLTLPLARSLAVVNRLASIKQRAACGQQAVIGSDSLVSSVKNERQTIYRQPDRFLFFIPHADCCTSPSMLWPRPGRQTGACQQVEIKTAIVKLCHEIQPTILSHSWRLTTWLWFQVYQVFFSNSCEGERTRSFTLPNSLRAHQETSLDII